MAIFSKSDKCTCALDWNVWCCYEHDLACLFGKDPRSAYRLWKGGEEHYWEKASVLQRRPADRRFWRCNRRHAPSFWGRVRSNIRYIGVRIGAFLPPY